jgi:hypothetical protein
MLTTTSPISTSRRYLLAAVALVAMVLAVLPGLAAGSASADPPTCHYDENGQYQCTQPGTPGTPGDPGDPGGGSSQPTCTLGGEYDFCIGTNACYYEAWHPPFKMPEGPKPSEDAKPMLRWCLPGGYAVFGPPGLQIIWIGGDEPQPPSLAEQAQTAIGRIDLTLPDLLTSPKERTVVNLPTWFWLDGADSEQVGTSAFGLRAIATVQDVVVDTGDGSSITCPWVSSSAQAEESCTYTYDRASRDGSATWKDRPAYEVSAHAVWALRFEMDGVNIVIPGAPTTLDGPTSTAVLRVDEVQSVVTGTK